MEVMSLHDPRSFVWRCVPVIQAAFRTFIALMEAVTLSTGIEKEATLTGKMSGGPSCQRILSPRMMTRIWPLGAIDVYFSWESGATRGTELMP